MAILGSRSIHPCQPDDEWMITLKINSKPCFKLIIHSYYAEYVSSFSDMKGQFRCI